VTQETSAAAAKVPTAVLSTTVRAREKARKKEADKTSKEAAEAADKAAAPSASDAGLILMLLPQMCCGCDSLV
jgi:26S proteasome regulatory subunit N2